MEAQLAILVAEDAGADGGQDAIPVFRAAPLRDTEQRAEIVDSQPGQHDTIVMAFYFLWRCPSGPVEEVIK